MYSSALKPFAFNTTDIEFLLAQVNFRPLFDAAGNAILNWDGTGAIYDARHRLIWDGTGMGAADAISAYGTSYQNGTDLSGLRDPSGMNNNLALIHASWGAVDQIFPRMAAADYSNYGNIYSGGALGAYAANLNYWGKYSDGSATDGSATGAFNANGSQNSKIDYTISIGGTQVATDGTAISMTNIVDYTPRMISLLTTTAGVVYDTWANHQVLTSQSGQVLYTAGGEATGTAITNWNGVGAIYNAAGDQLWDGLSSFSGTSSTGTAVSWTNTDSDTNFDGGFDDTATRMTALERTTAAPIALLAFAGPYFDINGDPISWNGIGAVFDANGDQLWNGFSSFNDGLGHSWTNTDTDNGPDTATTMTPAEQAAAAVQAIALFGHSIGSVPNPEAANHTLNEIYYDANGVATVLDWGDMKLVADGGLGQVDTQARFEGSAGVGEQFIGGLNPGVSPSNSFFVTFGQFFDHGLDFIDKGGQGQTIKITFSETDPLYGMKGPDGQPVHEITMARATVQSFDAAGPQYTDHTSPFIDQSQTYGSHEQLTTLLREWVTDPVTGQYHAGMNMLDGETLTTAWQNANGDMVHDTLPTLNELRAHVEATGRDALTWEDVLNLRNRDASGHVVAGNTESALILDSNPRFDDAHLFKGNAAQDSAVNAAIATLDAQVKAMFGANSTFEINATTHKLTLFMETLPSGSPPGTPHTLDGANAMYPFVNFANMNITLPEGAGHSAVSELLLASVGDHYIAGDGRVNENFGLTSIHHVFHEEHNFQVGNFIDALHREAISTNSFDNLHSFQVDMTSSGGSIDPVTHDYLNASGQVAWDLDKMFNAAKLVVEMEYQHAAVDQYARNVTPNIQEFVGYSPDKDPSVTLEYAQSIFRWGHSTLRETIDTIDPDHGLTGKIMGYALRDAFLNPDKYMDLGPASIILGMSHQQMNEVDEFVTPALNQGLLGQPLDLAAINIARGRDIGIPTLNDFREALGLARYSSWTEFGNNMQHPSSLVNFIAAYSFDGDLAAAQEVLDLVDGVISVGANGMTSAEAFAFLEGGDQGFNKIDTWIGGLAEIHQPGGLLGETFDLVFVTQIESLMDGDRFYYLYRLAGQQFAEEVGGGQLKDIVERNTGLTHLNGNIFGYADKYYDFGAKKEVTTDGTELQTTANNHKYGDVYATTHNADGSINFEATKVSDGALTLNPTLGIYTNTGRSSALDGTVVTINGKQYIRDTRLEDTGQDTGAALLNDGVNLDGTPNSGAESNEILVGTDRNDLMYANGGDDTVYGEGGDDIIFGGFGIDRLYGGDGSDRLYGGDNPDLMDGGSGDDFLYGESSGSDINGADQLIGGSGNDFVSGGVGIDKLSGGTGDDHVVGDGDTDPFTHGSDGNDWIEGNSGGDILYGDNGDDLLEGGADQDQMFGGNGDDIIRPGDLTGALTIGTDETLGGDGVTDIDGNGKQGFDIIDFSDNTVRAGGVKFSLADQINPGVTVNGTPTQTQAFQMEGVVGSAGDDTLTGGSTNAAGEVDNDWIIGGSGNDKLAGGAGNDVIIGGSVRLDALIGKYNSGYTHNNNNTGSTAEQQLEDARYQGASHRVLYSENIDNTGLLDLANAQLDGADYEKHFTELLRSDQFKNTVLGDGGTDGTADTVIFTGNRADYAVQIVTDNGSPTGNIVAYRITDTVAGRDGSDLIMGVEKFQFADGTFNTSNIRNIDPVITSNGGGATGAAAVAENTTLVTTVVAVDPNVTLQDYVPTQSLTYAIAGGADAAKFSIIASGANAGQLSFVSAPNFEAATDAGANNVYDVIVSVSDGLATDTQALAVTVTNVDEVATGALNITAYVVNGTQTNANLTAVNTVSDPDGMTGTVAYQWQRLNGGNWQNIAGATSATLANQSASTVRVVSTYTDGSFGTKTVISPETVIIGSGGTTNAANNNLTGTAGTDFVLGLAGNDTLNGGLGADTLDGGTGTDTAVFSQTLAASSFALNGAGQLVITGADGVDTLNSVENVRFGGAAGPLYGLSTGTNGADSLGGTNGQDLMLGFDGNDTYTVNNAGDVVVEVSASGGTDTVNSSVNHTLGANVENLNLNGAGNINGTGNTLNNAITGNTGNNTLTGGGGNDSIDGGTGSDTAVYAGGSANFAFGLNASGQVTLTDLVGSEGSDTLTAIETVRLNGTNFAVTATGATGSQLVTGTNGADALDGGAGNDIVIGGAGDDTITYNVNNGGTNNGGRDIIDGGSGTDTFVLVANNQSENFVIYTRAEAISAGFGAGLNAGTEIVVTRQQGAGLATVVAELKDIQEIKVQTGHLFTPQTLAGSQSNAGVPGLTTNIAATVGNLADNVKVVGDFTQTTLAYNTITVDGTAGNTTVDISNLTSAHRIVFNTGGTGDAVVGTLRPQDVINGTATGIAATVTDNPASSPSRHSFLSQEWQNLGDNGGFNHSRIDSYQIVDVAGWAKATAGSAIAAVSSISEHMSVELYQELAPLAGTVLQVATTQMDHMSLQTSVEPSTSGHKYHGPVDWLSDDDTFSHFVHNLNGHFIP